MNKSQGLSLRPSSSDRDSLNYGHRLYQKGLKEKEEREREIKEAKKEQEIQQRRYYTFKPEIDAGSKQLLRDANRDKPENRLLMLGQVALEKKEQQRTVLMIEDKLKCTFHPEINKKYCVFLFAVFRPEFEQKRHTTFYRSEKMASERSKNLSMEVGEKQASILSENKFEFLFEDAKRRQQHQSQLKGIVPDTECTFHPNIYQSQRHRSSVTGSEKFSRFLSVKHLSKERPPPAAVSEAAGHVDEKTGQAFFKPKIGRPPKNDRNVGSLPIGDYLYAQNKRKEEILRKKKIEEMSKSKANCNSSYVREESKHIIEGKKNEIFAEIFAVLDKDGDGIITAKNLNIAGIVGLCCNYHVRNSRSCTGLVHSTFLRNGRTWTRAKSGRICGSFRTTLRLFNFA